MDLLAAALDAAEELGPHFDKLSELYRSMASTRCGAHPVEFEESGLNANGERSVTNHGTPLYIAVVRDQPVAAAHLLSLGDNPNYAHPEHGDGPILHAAEAGYDECLDALLSSRCTDPAAVCTVDRKIFLGQGLPQYAEGGLSALHLAAVKGRVSTVRLLLRNTVVRETLLHRTDSFGRTVLQATMDSLGLLDPQRKAVRERLTEVIEVLCEALGELDAASILERGVPSHEAAVAADRDRNRKLRARCLRAEAEKKARERARGLEAIAKSYTPLRQSVFAPAADAFIRDGDSEGAVKEPFPGTFTFPLLSKEFCCHFWEELHHYEACAASDPSLGLPLHVRHDGNLGELQDCGFESTLQALEDACRPVLAEHMPHLGPFKIYHAFVTRNFVGREQNTQFKIHRDKSDLTFNICLHASEDLEGSSVGFYESPGDGMVPEEPEHRRFTYKHSIGHAVLHDGKQWHKTDPITQGTRGSLIAWARLCSDDLPRPPIGSLVRLADNPRTSGGVLADGAVGMLVEDDEVSRQPFQVSNLDGTSFSHYHSNDLVVVQEEPACQAKRARGNPSEGG